MKNLEVVKLLGRYNTEISNIHNNDLKVWVDEAILFSDDYILGSHHEDDCCETHYLEFSNINLDDFKGLKFDLSNENFFKRIPGYGDNNGWYSSNIDLIVIKDKQIINTYDVSECQDY